MENERNYIDELFDKELGAYEMGTASQGWAAVSDGLAKKGFWATLKSSVWFKAAATITSVGVVATLGFFMLKPYSVANESDPSSISQVQPSSQSAGNSPQFSVGSSQSTIGRWQSPVCSQQVAEESQLASYPETDVNTPNKTVSSRQSAASSRQSAVGSWQLAETSSEFQVSSFEKSKNSDQLSEPLSTVSNSHIANSENRENSSGTPNSKPEIRNTPPEPSNTLEQNGNPARYVEVSKFNNQQSTNDNKQTAFSERETTRQQLETQNSEPSTLNSELRTQNSDLDNSELDNSIALPIYYTLPQRGLVTAGPQDDFTIDLKQEHLSPPAPVQGYNPLSWAVSAYSAIHSPNVLLENNDPEAVASIHFVESGLRAPSITDVGVRFEARHQHLVFESGLGFFQFSQKANYQTSDVAYNETTTWNYWDSTYTQTDTLDSWFQVFGTDTVFHYATVDSTIQLFDSTSYVRTDTVRDDLDHTFTNTYKYLEAPLIVGYSFTKERFSATVKGGLIGSFLWQGTGKSISGSSKNDVYTYSHDDFPNIRLDLYTGLEARYSIGARYFVFGEAFYRRTFSPFIRRGAYSYNFDSYGLKLGAGVYF